MHVREGMSGCFVMPHAACSAIAVLALVGTGCGEERAVTAIRLTVRYDETPAWLHISGASDSGGLYGPTLLPDPLRPLAPDRESVMLVFAPQLDGAVLSLRVVGLSPGRVARTYGSVETEIAAGRIRSAVVWLRSRPECREGGEGPSHLCGGGDNPPIATGDAAVPDLPGAERDASVSVGAPTCAGASCMDASAPVLDAAIEEPPPVEEPPAEEPPPEEEPPPVEEPPPEEEPPPVEEPPPEEEPDPPSEPCADDSCVANACSANSCEMRCGERSSCAYDCGGAESCKARCDNATCRTDCSGADRCEASCEGQAECEIICGPGTDCTDVECRGEARCLLRCGGDVCELHCAEPRMLRDCGDGVYACNRECPS